MIIIIEILMKFLNSSRVIFTNNNLFLSSRGCDSSFLFRTKKAEHHFQSRIIVRPLFSVEIDWKIWSLNSIFFFFDYLCQKSSKETKWIDQQFKNGDVLVSLGSYLWRKKNDDVMMRDHFKSRSDWLIKNFFLLIRIIVWGLTSHWDLPKYESDADLSTTALAKYIATHVSVDRDQIIDQENMSLIVFGVSRCVWEARKM